MISTDATDALIQPTKAEDGKPLACKKRHFFTAVVDAVAVLSAYVEHHTSEAASSCLRDLGPRLTARHRRRRHARRVFCALHSLFSSRPRCAGIPWTYRA